MFVHVAVAWLLLAGFVLLVFVAVTLAHYIFFVLAGGTGFTEANGGEFPATSLLPDSPSCS